MTLTDESLEFPVSLSRALCGTGEGILIAIVFAIAAGTVKPIKTFAVINYGAVGFAALIYLTSPYLMLTLGSSACLQ